MKATIRDVAREAGVSIGTVSRVLNGHAAVSEESRARVDSVVRLLNYYPLRKRRSVSANGRLKGKRIAMTFMGMDRSLSSSPLIVEVAHGVEDVAGEAGASVELVNIPRLDEIPVVLKQDSLDGLILFGALQGNMVKAAKPALIKRLSALPSVWFIRRPKDCWGDCVGPNDWMIGQIAANHLVANGHRRLAYLSSRFDQVAWRIRGLSFAAHAEDAGASVAWFTGRDGSGDEFPLRAAHNPKTLEALVDGVLRSSPRPTAIFIPADSMAPFVYRALAARDIVIGKDISIMSCNLERPFIEALHPSLTTIDIHAELMGRLAAKQLALRLRGGAELQPAVEIAIDPTLLEGESVVDLLSSRF